MKRSAKLIALAVLGAAAVYGGVSGYLVNKNPVRSGNIALPHLSAPVDVRYDEFGVPHIKAANENDLYRTLGYVVAQDRLFQLEMARRLARGELAEILGPKLVDTDKLFRVLRIRDWADTQAKKMDMATPASQALVAYLEGINHYVATRPAPLEFDILGIPKRPFTIEDTLSVTGYLAYSFASAFKTEPALTYLRDELGPDYLKVFDLSWHAQGVIPSQAATKTAQLTPGSHIDAGTWKGLAQLAQLSTDAVSAAGLPQLQGSNAWAISGKRTASGKPILAGDPHISFATPAVWYEAHLSAPGFELYGHHPTLIPTALLGLNQRFAWSLTMFQNDDIDLVKEKLNPANANQAWAGDAKTGKWVDITSEEVNIAVKGAVPQRLTLRTGPHGPLVNDAFPNLGDGAKQPIAMWWALYAAEAPLLDAMYAMNRADTLSKARTAASMIHAPGLNVLWANVDGDIGWWAAAKLPKRPEGVDPAFILDAAKGEAEKPGWYPFAANPQEENPARGYIVSANHQPAGAVKIPGYYALPDRARRLDDLLADASVKWDLSKTEKLQLDTTTNYGPRTLAVLLPLLRERVTAADELALLDLLAKWDGEHRIDLVAPTIFNQLLYEIPHAAMADEVGDEMFKALLRVRGLDQAIPRLVADAESIWWDNKKTPEKESRSDTLLAAWQTTLGELRRLFGNDPQQWTWGRAHTVSHGHPLGKVKPLDKIFDVGPFPAPGGHETPNNYSNPIGPLPLAVTYGPSTRRVIDFAAPEKNAGINPVGQSGVRFDPHYADQAHMHVRGEYRVQHLSEDDVAAHTRSRLRFQPSH